MQGFGSLLLYFLIAWGMVALSSEKVFQSNDQRLHREPKFLADDSDRSVSNLVLRNSETFPCIFHFYCPKDSSNKSSSVTSVIRIPYSTTRPSHSSIIPNHYESKQSFWKKKFAVPKVLKKSTTRRWEVEGRSDDSTTSSTLSTTSVRTLNYSSQRGLQNDKLATTSVPPSTTSYPTSVTDNQHATVTKRRLPLEPIRNYDTYEGSISSQLQHLRDQPGSSTSHSCSTKVVGYYTSWGTHNVTKKILSYLTHILYAFPDVDSTGTISLSAQSAARLRYLVSLRGNDSFPKISLSIGGSYVGDVFSQLVCNTTIFQKLSDDLFHLMQEYRLDGIDIDWEYPNATEKPLFVKLMREFRAMLEEWKETLGRKERLLLTFAGPAGSESLYSGFDIGSLLEGDTVDFVNVMAYDFFGPWPSPSGKNTGPIAPLFYAAPASYSRKLNTHWTIEQYLCMSKAPHKIVLGVPFYGRYWNDVGQSVDGNPMWRMVDGDEVQGGHSSYREIASQYTWNKNYAFYYDDTAKAAFAWNNKEKTYLGYESSKCVDMKAQYVIQNKLGGVMIWAIDFDDDNLTLTKALTNGNMCKTRPMSLKKTQFDCYEKRWWTYGDSPSRSGMCGKLAPLFNDTYYAVCDPEDLTYSCCGRWGYCGSGPDFCSCPGCTNFGANPERIKSHSVKPTTKKVLWHTMEAAPGALGRCGPSAPRLNNTLNNKNSSNTTVAICNSDDVFGFCCSSAGYCGVGEEFCKCTGCVDFSRTPDYRYPEVPVPALLPTEKRWWTWDDGEDKSGKCGPDAPKINGTVEAICDPTSFTAPCCSAFGFCGASPEHCNCPTCKNYAIASSNNKIL